MGLQGSPSRRRLRGAWLPAREARCLKLPRFRGKLGAAVNRPCLSFPWLIHERGSGAKPPSTSPLSWRSSALGEGAVVCRIESGDEDSGASARNRGE